MIKVESSWLQSLRKLTSSHPSKEGKNWRGIADLSDQLFRAKSHIDVGASCPRPIDKLIASSPPCVEKSETACHWSGGWHARV